MTEPEFNVGERVRHKNGPRGTIIEVVPHYAVDWDGGSIDSWGIYHRQDLVQLRHREFEARQYQEGSGWRVCSTRPNADWSDIGQLTEIDARRVADALNALELELAE